jgi:hypothetical protein
MTEIAMGEPAIVEEFDDVEQLQKEWFGAIFGKWAELSYVLLQCRPGEPVMDAANGVWQVKPLNNRGDRRVVKI